jgi:hypothetical protein
MHRYAGGMQAQSSRGNSDGDGLRNPESGVHQSPGGACAPAGTPYAGTCRLTGKIRRKIGHWIENPLSKQDLVRARQAVPRRKLRTIAVP